MQNKKGFTLIELLVVVAIIGLLSSIIIINMNSQRFEAHDANIKSFMHQLRNAAEMLYTASGNDSYGLICTEDNKLSDSGELGIIKKAIEKENPGNEIVCFESEDEIDFAASFPLTARKGKHWCVESAGISVEILAPVTSANCR
jgi:prepilin-type N-terminal cleavage/methylation domain-containing protein